MAAPIKKWPDLRVSAWIFWDFSAWIFQFLILRFTRTLPIYVQGLNWICQLLWLHPKQRAPVFWLFYLKGLSSFFWTFVSHSHSHSHSLFSSPWSCGSSSSEFVPLRMVSPGITAETARPVAITSFPERYMVPGIRVTNKYQCQHRFKTDLHSCNKIP